MIKKEVLALFSTTDDIAMIEEVYTQLPDTRTINDIAFNELTLPLQIKNRERNRRLQKKKLHYDGRNETQILTGCSNDNG